MFVSESSIFDQGKIRIKVSSMDGGDILLEVNPDITVDHLKIQISSHLYDPVESVKTSLYHRILHVNSGKVLEEDKTLAHCGVQDNDELLLIKKRVPGPNLEGADTRIREDSKKTPTADDVKQATQGLPVINADRKAAEPSTMNFKTELANILVSLIDAAQKILCLNPEAAKIFEEVEKCILDEKTALTSEPPVDQSALEQLTSMGFTQQRAIKALKLNQMSAVEAIQWILEHEVDTDIDEPLQGTEDATSSLPSPSSPEDDASADASGTTAADKSLSQALKLAQMTGPQKVKKMLDGFRAYRRKEFKPNPKALRTLVEMGFEEGDAMDSLCIHGNKQEEACEWLLSGGQTRQAEQNLEGGLDPESPVYKAIMANPIVQLGLNNPKSLLAFLMILENPSSTQQWLNDHDTGPMLIQITRIYHAERNALKASSSSPSSSSSS